jgi:hypothetical protein
VDDNDIVVAAVVTLEAEVVVVLVFCLVIGYG